MSYNTLQINPNNLGVQDAKPNIHKEAFVAKNTVVSGNVEIQHFSYILYNNVIKTVGPNSRVHIAPSVYIMDHACIKADGGKSVTIGHKSIISSHAQLHNCTVGKGGFVGPRATVSENAVIHDYGGLAAGSFLEAGQTIPSRQFWAGTPAVYLREVTEEDVEYFKDIQDNNDKLREIYASHTNLPGQYYNLPSPHQMQDINQEDEMDPDEYFDTLEPFFREEMHLPMQKGDARRRAMRIEKMQPYLAIDEPQKEILYDGSQEKGPAYLNEFRRTNQVENDISKSLEYDPEKMRMKKEDFEIERQQVDDKEFRRKF